MTAPIATGSVPLADHIAALRWLRDALRWLDGVDPANEATDEDLPSRRLSKAFLELHPDAAVQLDLLASIEHARLVKAANPAHGEEHDDARR